MSQPKLVGSKSFETKIKNIMIGSCKKAFFLLLAGIIVSAGLFFVSKKAEAATYTWDGGGVNANWDTPENWSTDVVPTLTDIANFTGPGCSSNCSPTINVSINIQGITIASTYAGTITQASGTTITITGGTTGFTVAGGIFVGGDGLILIASASGDFIQTGGVFTNSSGGLTVYRNITLTSGTFNNSGIITLGDTGSAVDTTLTCTGVLPGTLAITKTDVSGTSSDVTISSGCTVNLSAGPTTTLANLTNGGTINVPSGTWTYNSGDTFTLTNNGTINHSGSGWIFYSSSLNNSGTINYSGTTISIDGSLTYGGTFDLTGKTITFTNNTIDNTTISCTGTLGGKVVFNKVAGSGTTTATVGSGCTINLGDSPSSVLENNLTNNGTIVIDSGTWSYTNGEAQAIINNGTITHNGTGWAMDNTTLTNSGGTINYAGTSLSIDLSFTQFGTFDLTGKTVTFTNGTTGGKSSTVSCTGSLGGTVVITKTGSTGSGTFTVSTGCSINLGASPTTVFQTDMVNSGTIVIDSGTWTMTSVDGNTFTNSGTITHNGSGWDFNGTVHFTNTGTVTYAGTNINIENNFTQNGTFDTTGKTIFFDGTANAADTILVCGSNIQGNVTVNKADTGGTLTLGSNCVVEGIFTKTDGVIGNPGSAYILEVRGNFINSTSDTFGGANMTLKFGGTANQTFLQAAGTISSPVTIDKASGTVTLSSNLVLATGTALNITSGTLDHSFFRNVTAGAVTVGVSGVWLNTGTGDVILSGDVSNSGVITMSSSDAGQCTDVNNDITITSSSGGVQRTWSGSGTFDLFNVGVTDQAGTITTYNSAFSNSTWTNGSCGTTFSGTVYLDEGASILISRPTVRAKINGAGTYSASANGSGVFIIPNVIVAANDVVTIFLDGASEKAALITKATDSNSISGLDLYQNRIILRHENAGPITNANLDQYDSGNDADIGFTVTTSNLTVLDGYKLIVWTGKTFTPGGTVTTDPSSSSSSVDGDLTIQASATLSMGTNALSVGGDFVNAGTFSESGSPQVTTFTATATGHIIDNGTGNLDSVVFNGSGGGWSFSDASNTLAGDLTMTAGTLSGTTNITVNGGDLTGNGTINLTAGTFTLSNAQSTNWGGDTNWVFYDFVIGSGSHTATGSGNITANSITATGSLSSGSKTYILTGSGTPLTGSFSASTTSTVRFTGSSATTIPALVAYGTLEFKPTSGNPVYTLGTVGDITFDNVENIVMGDGVNPLTVDGLTRNSILLVNSSILVNSGATYTKGSGTIYIQKPGVTIGDNNSTKQDLGILYLVDEDGEYGIPAGSVTLQTSIKVTSINIGYNANLSLGTHTLTLTGSGSPMASAGTITVGTGTVEYIGSSATSIYSITYYNLSVGTTADSNAGVTYTQASHITVSNVLTVGNASSTNTDTYVLDTGRVLYLNGSGTPLVITSKGAFTANTSSEVSYNGTSATNITGATYKILNIGNSVDTNAGVTYSLAGNISTGAINVGNLGSTNTDTFSQGSYNITTSGTFGINSKGAWSNLSTGDVILGGDVYNVGTITLNSNNGNQCIDAANDIVITSSSAGVQRTWSGLGTFNLYNLNVTDQLGSVTTYYSSLTNTSWNTAGCTTSVTGTIYTDEAQATPLTNGPTVRVKIDGAGSYSAVANGSGVYTVSGITASAGSIVTVFLDNATEKAVMVTRAADNYSTITANLVQNRVILRSDDGSPITNTNLDIYDSSNDADVRFTVTGGNLTVTTGSTLLINTSTTFTPGGTVSVPAYKQTAGTFNGGSYAYSADGNITVTGGTFNSTSGTLTMTSGNIDVSAGVFVHNSGSLVFAGNNQSITTGSNQLYNLTINNSNGLSTFTVNGDVVVNNTLTLSSGVLVGSGAFHAKKDVVTTNSSDHIGNAIIFDGTGAQSLNASGGAGYLPGIAIDKSSGTLTVSDTIHLVATGITAFDYVQGAVDMGISTIVFKGNNITIDAGAVDFNNVTIQTGNPAASVTITGTLDVNNDLNIIQSGVLLGAITVAGNLTSTDSDMSGSTATITMDGIGTQTINTGASYLPTGTMTINKASGTAQLGANLALGASQALLVTSGSFDQGASYNLTVGPVTIGESGEWTNTGTGNVVLGGGVSNSGIITFNTSGGSQCVDVADDIVITSSSNGVQRAWSGAGTFVMYNVSATDQTGSVTVYSSTLSNSNWLEGACAGTLTQTAYRWYENVNAGNVIMPLADENTSLTLYNQDSKIRLRMSVGVSGGSIGAGTKTFKLQWSPSTTVGWHDVATADGLIWRFADNAALSDGATTSGLVLSASNVAGLYRETNTSITNPLQVNNGQKVEYDFALDPVGATAGVDYYFRIVEVGNITLNAYTNYAKITFGTKNFAGGNISSGGGSGGGTPQGGGGQSGLQASNAWWNTSWNSRKKITLDNTASSSNLVDFPVLVTLSASNIDYSKTQNAGQDVRFVDSDNVTLLNHQIETWNESGNSIVWVKVPQINASSGVDHIWVYYNNSGASDGQSATNVWDSNFKGVWHMSNASTAVTDSTTSSSTGTPDGPNTTYNISGQVGSAISTDGSGYKIVFANSNLYYPDSAKTYCWWMKTSTTVGGGGLRFTSNNSSLGVADNLGIIILNSNNYKYFNTGSVIANNDWHYLCYRVTGLAQNDLTNSKMWVDGVEQSAGSVNITGETLVPDTLHLGHWFNASYDELRISNTARSTDWILAEYKSMNNTMNTYTSEESRETGSGGGTPQTGGGSGGGVSASP